MAINYEGIKYQDFVEHGITKTVDQLTEDDYVRTNKGAKLPLQALRVEKQIQGEATSDDLTSDNSLLMQVGDKIKKLPGSAIREIDSRTYSSLYDEKEVVENSSVDGYGLNANLQYKLAIFQPYDGVFNTKIFAVEKGKSYIAKNVYGDKNNPYGVTLSPILIAVGETKAFVYTQSTGLTNTGKTSLEFASDIDGYAYVATKATDDDATLYEKIFQTCSKAIDTLAARASSISGDVASVDASLTAEKDYTDIDEVIESEKEVGQYSVVEGKGLNANSQYKLAMFQTYFEGSVNTKIFQISNGKKYKAVNVYGYRSQPQGLVTSVNLIPSDGTNKSYTTAQNNGLSNLGKADIEFTATIDGYAYVLTLAADNDAALFEVGTRRKTIKEKFNEVGATKNNQWAGKKVVVFGTSVTFGTNATKSWLHIACEKLGFSMPTIGCVPGLAIEANKDASTGLWYPKQYGSSTLTKDEYIAAKNAGLSTMVLDSSPVPASFDAWQPGGNYNAYYRTWENVLSGDAVDADLYLLEVLPNNGNYGTSDWDAFDKVAWAYTDGSNFAEHRGTFAGALLYLMDKIYTANPKARIAFIVVSNFSYSNGLTMFKTLADYYHIPFIDLWAKMQTTPKSLSQIKSLGGADWHPSTFGQERLGDMAANELLLIG